MMKDTKTLEFVYKQAIKAVNMCNHGGSLADPATIQDAIDNSKVELAQQIIDAYHIYD